MALTYAQTSDLQAYAAPALDDVDAGALTDLINRAERDIDSIVGPWATAETVGSLTLPTSSITVDSTQNFPGSGTVTVDGQSVTYTGKTLTTLTGASGGTGEIAEGSTVAGTSDLKFDPIAQLTAVQQGALNRATCAQAEYRYAMGEPFFVQAQYQSVSGPDFSQTGQLPRIGPKVYAELTGFGLLKETYVG